MIAVIAALKDEIADYLSRRGFMLDGRTETAGFYRSPDDRDVVVVQGGIGRARAEEATRQVVKRFGPELVVATGFAGGVVPGLRTGDLLVCQKVWAVEGQPAEWSPDMAESHALLGQEPFENLVSNAHSASPRYVRGDCLSVPNVVSNSLIKGSIGERFPVSAIDMESFWITRIADQHGIPTMVVKSLLDPVEQSLPAFVDGVAANGGDQRWRRALGHALAKPSEIPKMVHLAVQVRVARASLSAFLARLSSMELLYPSR